MDVGSELYGVFTCSDSAHISQVSTASARRGCVYYLSDGSGDDVAELVYSLLPCLLHVPSVCDLLRIRAPVACGHVLAYIPARPNGLLTWATELQSKRCRARGRSCDDVRRYCLNA